MKTPINKKTRVEDIIKLAQKGSFSIDTIVFILKPVLLFAVSYDKIPILNFKNNKKGCIIESFIEKGKIIEGFRPDALKEILTRSEDKKGE